MATMTDWEVVQEARDWQGRLLDCQQCEHHAWSQEDRCRLGHACVQDRYARRIDRFFRWHPQLAVEYFEHDYFEVRALAAKHADVFHLPRLVTDSDETVRRIVVERLPANSRFLKALRRDPHREVRIRVAQKIPLEDLLGMIDDEDYLVRQHVAKRLPTGLLVKMIHDSDPEVRKVVAQRIGPEWLLTLARDPDSEVRVKALRRLAPDQLERFVHDADWRVRYEVAMRIERSVLPALAEDVDPLVGEMARQRLAGREPLPEACRT